MGIGSWPYSALACWSLRSYKPTYYLRPLLPLPGLKDGPSQLSGQRALDPGSQPIVSPLFLNGQSPVSGKATRCPLSDQSPPPTVLLACPQIAWESLLCEVRVFQGALPFLSCSGWEWKPFSSKALGALRRLQSAQHFSP